MNDRVTEGCCGLPGEPAPPAFHGGRRIGPWGTATRLAGGVAALVWGLAVAHEHPWLGLPGAGSPEWGLAAGLLIAPGLITLALRLRGRSAVPLRAGGGTACAMTALVIVLWHLFPVAVLVFIGASLLLLAARGDDGCEVLAFPNWLLRRRDYLTCLPFTPVDRWETRRQAQLHPERAAALSQ